MGDGHGGIDKVASSWTLRGWSPPWTRATITLRGWSPPWTRATVTLRGLKSPSTWMYDSTTYRNHAKNLRVSKLRLHTPISPLYILATCMLYFPLLIYSLYACLNCVKIA